MVSNGAAVSIRRLTFDNQSLGRYALTLYVMAIANDLVRCGRKPCLDVCVCVWRVCVRCLRVTRASDVARVVSVVAAGGVSVCFIL